MTTTNIPGITPKTAPEVGKMQQNESLEDAS